MTRLAKTLILTALLAIGSPALAQGNGYSESITLSGFSAVYGAMAPHASPLSFDLVGYDPRLTGQVQIVSTPAPSVFVQVRSRDWVGGGLGAELKYEFDVVGPSNAFVPIAYLAHFNLRPMSFLHGATGQFVLTAYSVGFGNSQSVYADLKCDQSCRTTAQPSGTGSATSTVSVNVGGSTYSTLGGTASYGTISGVLMAPTNSVGLGFGLVSLRVSAGGSWSDGTGWAFLDPRFEVDPAYLAVNPGASIQIMAGVGNESGVMPVPEPGAALLMLVGLAGLAFAARHRHMR